jgi:hypothetical protein
MPVKVKKQGTKFRIVGPNGRVEKTKKGTPVDGGGHSSKSKAEAQARAINASIGRRK